MKKYLCKKKYNNLVVFVFDEEPTYDPLLDYWDGEAKRILSFDEARPYILKVTFKNSPFEISNP